MTAGLFETGRVTVSDTIDQSAVASVSFANSYDNPVVVVFDGTGNGDQPVEVRARNVSSSGCEVFMEEPDDEGHAGNDLHYIAAEAGAYTVDGVRVEAGIHTTSAVRTNNDGSYFGDTVSFSQSFSSAPAVLHGLGTYNNSDFMSTQANSVSASDFTTSQEALSTGTSSATEDIHWIALETVSSGTIDGSNFEARYANDGSSDGDEDSAHTINYNASFSSNPDIIAKGQTVNGTDGFITRTWTGGTVSTTAHDLVAEEDTISDTEQGHADETFGWLAIDPSHSSVIGDVSSLTADSGSEVNLDWSGAANATSYGIYRSTSSGNSLSDYNRIDTTSSTSYTDSNPNTGTNYYRVLPENGSVDGTLSSEVSATGVIVGTATASASSGTVATFASASRSGTATASATSGSLTTTGIVRTAGTATATTTAAGDSGVPVTGVTTLPDAQQPTLGNGVEDEVAVSIPDNLNYGQFRVQIRETGQSSWDSSAVGFAEQTVAADSDTSGTVDTAFLNREDGEEYEVRVRSETEHETGAWTSPVSIVTNFPGVQNLQIVSVGTTSVDLQFDDVSDNEDGVLVWRRQRYGGSWGEWRQVDDIGPYTGDTSTITYTEDTPRPDREYQWYLEPYTEDTSATTSTVSTTTNSLGVQKRSIPSEGWHVVVERPDGRVFSPTLAEDAEWIPRTNALPKVRIPVERSERWTNTEYEGAPLTVYKDGEKLPIEELEVVDKREDRVILEGRGGLELLGRTQVNYQQKKVHVAAEEIVTADTSYGVNADAPTVTREENVALQTIDSEGDFSTYLSSSIPADEPARLNSDGTVDNLATLDAAIPWDSWSYYSSVIEVAEQDGDLINQRGLELNGVAADIEAWTTVGLDYDLPSDRVGIAVRFENVTPSTEHVAFDIRVNGTTVTSIPSNYLLDNSGQRWFEVLDPGEDVGGLAAGSHEIRVVPTGAGADSTSDSIVVNGAAIYDTRDYGSLTSSVSGGDTNSPKTHAHNYQLLFDEITTTQSVVGGRMEVTISGTSNGQQLALSNDSGATWRTSSNTTAFETDWNEPAASLRSRVTLSYDEGSYVNGLQRDNGHTLDLVDLFTDLQDTPILRDQSYDQTTLSVLQDIADYGNFVFEVRQGANGPVVEWTQPGQRSDGFDPSVGDYSNRKSTERSYDRVVVKGAGVWQQSVSFTSNYDTYVSLPDSHIVDGSESVYNPSDGTQYERGSDYNMNYLDGSIEVLSTGSMSDATSYEMNYRSRVIGSWQADGVTNPKTLTKTIPSLTTGQTCDQAAFYLGRKVQTPRYSARLTVDNIDPTQSLVAALTLPEEVDKDQSGTYVPEEFVNKTASTEVRLGTRDTVDELIQDIERRLAGVTQQV